MRYALSCGLLPLVIVLLLVLGAARPFDRVPSGDECYNKLQQLNAAGLLGDYSLPEGELSRLEVSVLLQRALNAYGESAVTRGADAALETTLSSLLAEFSEEMSQLGAKPALPRPQSATGVEMLIERVEAIEEEMAEEEAGNDTYASQMEPTPEAPEEEGAAIDVAPYGYFNIQGRLQNTKLTTEETQKTSDVNVYWGEFGWDVSKDDWSGRFSVLWDDAEEDIRVYEAWAKYLHPSNGWFFQAGQVLLPFGNNDYYFPTYPAVNDLGFTTAHAVGVGVERPGWGMSAYVFNPKVEMIDEQDELSDYSVVWNMSEREASECQDGWKLRAGYTSHLATSDLRIAGEGPHHDRVAAYNVFGRYDWGGNRFHLIADYTAALDEFDVRDMDANADQLGDQPRALNTEFVYEPCPDNLWGVSYQATSEMQDYAETRYGVLYGKRLSDLAMLKLEYTHGEFGSYATAHQDSDDSVVAEININF